MRYADNDLETTRITRKDKTKNFHILCCNGKINSVKFRFAVGREYQKHISEIIVIRYWLELYGANLNEVDYGGF